VSLLIKRHQNRVLLFGPGSAWRVELLQGAGHLRIQVSDASTHLPALAAPVPDAEHGRGLQIVEALSTSWGTTARNGLGKTT
jgi:hypothetical protein